MGKAATNTSIRIKAGGIEFEGVLNDTNTARAVADALPIEATAQRWGGEIYFPIHVRAELEEDARDVLQPGELGYWPVGTAFCIFFGPTPASDADEIRAASDVNVLGKLSGSLEPLWDVQSGQKVTIERLE
jgi:hypothetical protein